MKVLYLDYKGVTPLESLDKHDKQILYIKSRNARIPISKIAEHVPLSPDGVKYRLKKLEDFKILVGSRTAINVRNLGFSSYHVFIELTNHSVQKQKEYIERLVNHPFINAIVTYTGKWDMEIAIMTQDVYHFNSLLQEILDPNFVADYEIMALVGTIKSSVIPEGFVSEAAIEIDYRKNDSSFFKDFRNRKSRVDRVKIDNIDFQILQILSENANPTLLELGEKLGVSKDTITNRIKRMIDSNVIFDFRPVINYSALGLSVQTLLIKIVKPSADVNKRIETWLRGHTNVLWAVRTLGKWDLLVYVITQSQDQLHKTIDDFRQRFGDSVKNYETLFAYEEYKYTFLPAGLVQDKLRKSTTS